jgi:hypothetical protein
LHKVIKLAFKLCVMQPCLLPHHSEAELVPSMQG